MEHFQTDRDSAGRSEYGKMKHSTQLDTLKGVWWLLLGPCVDYQSLCAFSHVYFIIQYSLHGETWNYFRDSNDKNNDFLNDQQHTPNSFSDSGVPAIFSCVLFKILSHSLCDPRLLVHFYRVCWRIGPQECLPPHPLIRPPLEFRWPMTPRRERPHFTWPQRTTRAAFKMVRSLYQTQEHNTQRKHCFPNFIRTEIYVVSFT